MKKTPKRKYTNRRNPITVIVVIDGKVLVVVQVGRTADVDQGVKIDEEIVLGIEIAIGIATEIAIVTVLVIKVEMKGVDDVPDLQ